MQDFYFFFFFFFLLSPSLVSYQGEYFYSSVAPNNQGHISPYMLWVLINTRVNFATDVTEDGIRPLYISILVI